MSSIREVFYDADWLRLIWGDARESRLLALWLRDHCQMPGSRDPKTGQRLVKITELPVDTKIDQVQLEDSSLAITFKPDGHRSVYDIEWLYHNCYCLNQPYDERSAAGKTLWHGRSFSRGLPRQCYREFCQQSDGKLAALRAVRDYGFVILDNLPCEPGQVTAIIETFGFVRRTNYGSLFDVRAKIEPNNLAYTNLGLGCHLDNPYRDPAPGLQLLHCLQSSAEGGESILQDGFMAAKLLADENPAHFACLQHNWLNFRFSDDNAELRSRVPLIETNDRGEVIKLRFNNRSVDTIKLAPEQMQAFYSAYRHFAEILERKTLQIQFKLQPGELILFDNSRILHARSAYAAAGSRHLQGAYSDLDGLYSSLAKLEAAT